MIKSNTKVLFNKVAPGGKSKLARAGTCATERNRNHATRASNSEWELWYQVAVQAQEPEVAPQEHDEVVTMAGTGRTCEVRPAATW